MLAFKTCLQNGNNQGYTRCYRGTFLESREKITYAEECARFCAMADRVPRFAIGDRVRVMRVGENRLKCGMRGAVITYDVAPWVAFDKPTHLGDADNPLGIDGWVPGHMDILTEDQLEPET